MEELFSIEVFVRKIYSIDVTCHLPSLSFRLLDFPTQTIHITDSERIAKIQDKISENPDYVKDLNKLKNSKGDIIFNKGKSCLFPLSFESAHSQLSEIPLYIVMAENVAKSPHFLGSIGISLAKIMNTLRDKMARDPLTICNESVKGSYPLKNLMGSRIAKLAVEVKLFYYGSNLVHHIPALSNIADKIHDTSLGTSEHLVSNEAISSVMEELESGILNKTSDLFSPEESDSDKDKDETDSNLNPPPLFYQAVPQTNTREKDTLSKHVQISKPKPESPKRYRTKSGEGPVASDTKLDKFIKFSQAQQLQQPSLETVDPIDVAEMMERGYDPKRFDLIRAVLTELTYLTDFLDPDLANNLDKAIHDTPRQPAATKPAPKPPGDQPKPVSVEKPRGKTPRRYGLTNSYILRLSKLGPDKALEVLSKHMSRQSASSLIGRLHDTPPKKSVKPLVDRAALKAQTKPLLVDSECQTVQQSPPTPKVAWQDQSPVFSPKKVGSPPGFTPPENPAQNLAGTAPFAMPQEGQPTYSTPFQSTSSMTMAQVLAAMQALAQTGTSQEGQREVQSRMSRQSSLRRANSNIEYNYSDNFEEPSCVSLSRSVGSPAARPISRAANSRLSSRTPVRTVEEDEQSEEEEEENRKLHFRRSTRNTRYERRSSSIKTASAEEQDSSSTTSTAASTANYSFRRTKSSKSKKSQTSLGSHPTSSQRLRRSHSSNSGMSTSKACQTPAPARSFSTQTDNFSESEAESVQTVLPSPTRDLVQSDHVISSHSSLESGSIYIGTDSEGEDEEDPLKLSYLLSTESVQFSDEDQPTSLLKLCSPREARAVNRFMYTF